ncbi:MAG: ABC transporter permease [Ferrimicrobium sp.]|uniref:ABC transporter permease n=1 Tax=Ferrimicrobium acidiphilum TaxID=121039 RepID=A0ABV3Y2F6_9ACTN|nr:ABC transporter permease [Ferrimicrobium sp.]
MRLTPVRHVAQRELAVGMASRVFRISTVILILAVLAAVVIPKLTAHRSARVVVDLAIPGHTSINREIQSAAALTKLQVIIHRARTPMAANLALRRGQVAIAVEPNAIVVGHNTSNSATLELAHTLAAELGFARFAAHLPPHERPLLALARPLDVRVLGGHASDSAEIAVGLAAIILIYSLLSTYGYRIAGGVSEEKTSRIVEVLLARIDASELLVGKVLGIGLLSLVQILMMLIAYVLAASLVGAPIPLGHSFSMILVTLASFLVGYAFYATLFAAAGALVVRSQDVYAISLPVQIPIIVGYIVGFQCLLGSPNLFDRILGYIPLTSPVLLPALVASGTFSFLDVVIALVICAVGAVGAMRVASALYRTSILWTGTRPPIRVLLSSRSQGAANRI